MIVVNFATLADFIAELGEEKEQIADRIVRWTTNRRPEQPEEISFQWEGWATAAAICKDGDYLYEICVPLGRESEQAGVRAGPENADKAADKLRESCRQLGLRLRPGKIEVF